MSNEKDDFWDLSRLVPKKKASVAPFSTKEKTVSVSVVGDEEKSNAETKLTLTSPIAEEGFVKREYDRGFVKGVAITRLADKFDFYGNFRKAALLYFDFKTPKCDFATFYSYMPQYSQFNSAQKNFYFYWRDSVRRGKYIKTDYSYFYLYVYEILNLPDKISPEKGLEMLVDLWIAYRGELPNVDANMALWLQDYCLIYGLECPMEKIGGFIFDIINATDFKEFYLTEFGTMGEDGTNAILAYLSDYDWQKGKYAGGDSKSAYRKHMLSAMGRLVEHIAETGEFSSQNQKTEKIVRNAFRNSLCTHSVKCRLEIEYIPCGKAEHLRKSVTAAIRYTENLLRAALGIKSRLSVIGLPDEYKKIIDVYFNEFYERVNRERIKASAPEYEKLYDAEETELSISSADEIERASWSTTARLVAENDVDGQNTEYYDLAEDVITETQEQESQEDNIDCLGLGSMDMNFLRAAQNGDFDSIRKICAEIQEEPLTVAERINEAFSDSFGDIILEGDGCEITTIEDYKEEIEEWLTQRMK